MDRGRFTADTHYVSPPDDPFLAPLPFSCNFRLANTDPNFLKLLTIIKTPGGVNFKNIGGRSWITTKATTQIFNSQERMRLMLARVMRCDERGIGMIVRATWPDFERLFAPGTAWTFCACRYSEASRLTDYGRDSGLVMRSGVS